MFVVFGATGRVGGSAVAELLRLGLRVRAVSRDLMRAAQFVPDECEIVTADLRDRSGVERAIEGATGVLLVCPLASSTPNVVNAAQRIIDASAGAIDAMRPQTVVAISGYGAHQRSGTGLATIFHRLERHLGSVPASVTFLRSAEHVQNWARYALVARRRGVLESMHHPVTKLFPVVSADDVGTEAAHLLAESRTRAATGRPRVVHIEGPCRCSAVDVAATFSALVSRPVHATELRRDAWHARLLAAGSSDEYALLVEQFQDAHNSRRIDVEWSAGELRRGRTTLSEALNAAIPPHIVAAGDETGREHRTKKSNNNHGRTK